MFDPANPAKRIVVSPQDLNREEIMHLLRESTLQHWLVIWKSITMCLRKFSYMVVGQEIVVE